MKAFHLSPAPLSQCKILKLETSTWVRFFEVMMMDDEPQINNAKFHQILFHCGFDVGFESFQALRSLTVPRPMWSFCYCLDSHHANQLIDGIIITLLNWCCVCTGCKAHSSELGYATGCCLIWNHKICSASVERKWPVDRIHHRLSQTNHRFKQR